MQGKANISIKNVNSDDKESYDMTYSLTGGEDQESLQSYKDIFDAILSTKGVMVDMSPACKEILKKHSKEIGELTDTIKENITH